MNEQHTHAMSVRSRSAVTAVLLGAALSFSLPAQAQSPVRHGRELAKEFCARCHAIGRHDRSSNPHAMPFRRLSQKIDLESLPRRLQRGLAANHPPMPEFRFKARDAHDLRDYLRTIQE
jgi:mono/diheme cytochrome c family protein